MGCPLVILGAGGHAKVVADIALRAGFKLIGFLDDNTEQAPLPGYRVLGDMAWVQELLDENQDLRLIIAVGDNFTRKELAKGLQNWNTRFATVVHPSAVVSPYAAIGAGTVVMPHVTVNAGTRVGDHVILNTACSVDHDCVIGAFAHISPGVHLAGTVRVEEGAHLGVGVSVIPRKTIGAWSVVGAGGAVVEDIPPGVVAVGVPARVIRHI